MANTMVQWSGTVRHTPECCAYEGTCPAGGHASCCHAIEGGHPPRPTSRWFQPKTVEDEESQVSCARWFLEPTRLCSRSCHTVYNIFVTLVGPTASPNKTHSPPFLVFCFASGSVVTTASSQVSFLAQASTTGASRGLAARAPDARDPCAQPPSLPPERWVSNPAPP